MSDPVNPTPAAPAPVPAAPAAPAPAPLAASAEEAALRARVAQLTAERDQHAALANAGAGLREQLIRTRAEIEATKAGLLSPGLARFLPIDGAAVDAAGNVTGLDKVVERWRSTAPEVFKSSPVVVPAQPGTPAGSPPAATPAAVVPTAPTPTFGPGVTAPPPAPAPTAVDARKLKRNSKEFQEARARLYAEAAAKDNAVH